MPSDPGNIQAEAVRAAIRQSVAEGRHEQAWQLLRPQLLTGEAIAPWNLARQALRASARDGWTPPTARRIRLGVLCGYEAAAMAEQLPLACLALDIDAELYVAPYGQLEQELLATGSGLAKFEPTHVLIAPSTFDLSFPELAEDPERELGEALKRWQSLWDAVASKLGARIVQHAFVVPDETPLGHISMRLPGSRVSLVRELNRRLADAAGSSVLLVDCERLAARLGKQRWIDPRLWYAARQPYGAEAQLVLARETAAVLAGDVGLAARCLVVDLDNTLWGGLVAEEGAAGVVLGQGPEGEAYAAFQDYLRALRERGVILAVASKNDIDVAREPFMCNERMRLTLDDFAAFVADWRRKPEQVADIASRLDLGLASIVFADDNPAECAEVAAAHPEVSTIPLDVPPSERVRRLASSLRFEASTLSRADVDRHRSYAARARAAELKTQAATLEEFWRSLEMRAHVRVLDSSSVERATQLTQKTNQFNLTLNRRSRDEIECLASDESAICRTLELEDRFASHGLIGLTFALPNDDDPDTAMIDTLLLSCRVIGRTAERHLLSHLCQAARERGFVRLRGVYVPGPRNAVVATLYPDLGFVAAGTNGNCWEYDLVANGPIESAYIEDAQ
jgi:FkbH-like protein